MTLTHGEGALYSTFDPYGPSPGADQKARRGFHDQRLHGHGRGFRPEQSAGTRPAVHLPGTEVYEGMIIGEHNKGTDLVVNPLKEKQLTTCAPPARMTR